MKMNTVTAYELRTVGRVRSTATTARLSQNARLTGRPLARSCAAPEQARGSEEQYEDEQTEAHELLHRRGQEDRAERFGDRHEQTARNRPRHAPHAPDDDDVERRHRGRQTRRWREREDR